MAKLQLESASLASMQFFGGKGAEDAERVVALLAPSCEFSHRIRRWVFPLSYLPDIAAVLKTTVQRTVVTGRLIAGYRAMLKRYEQILAVRSLSRDSLAIQPYANIFHAEYMPHAYQRHGIAMMLAARRLLLGDAVGLGKTIQSVGAMALAMQRGVCSRAMVVTLASLKGQWCDEAKSYLLPDAVNGLASAFVPVRGDRRRRQETYADPNNRVLVLNYELFLHDAAIMPPTQMVILDEAARIKNLGAQTTQLIRRYCAANRVRYRYALTATAIENHLDDLYSILTFLGDQSLGFRTYFTYHFCKLRRFQAPNGAMICQIIGHQNLEEARRRTVHAVFRRTKDDVGLDLPELVVRNALVNLGVRQREVYDALVVDAKNPESQIDPLQRSLLLREACDSLELVKGAESNDSAKLDELEYIIAHVLGAEHAVVIFTQWERMAKIICNKLRAVYSDGGPHIISGETRDEDRDTLRRSFNTGQFKCLVMTDAGKAGLNLQACETLVNFELPWNPATLKQRIGRMHRAGQKHAVTTVINLIADQTIEHKVAERLMRRHRVFDKVLKAASDELLAMDLSKTLTVSELLELL